jgi:glyoxylase-like metal-dependent hydrolase (beta-lactamase superfamily II)
MRPTVTPFFHAESHTFSYLVVCEATRAAAVIDPCLDFDAASGRSATRSVDAIAAAIDAQGLSLAWVLETHAHADHLTGAQVLKARYPRARLGIGAGIEAVQAHFRPVYGLPREAADLDAFDHVFADGERFAIGALEVEVIATPGHTSDSLSYRIGDAVFVGDSLFMPDGGTARCDFPGGSARVLFASVQRLFALPDATRVFVCHDYGPGGRAVACETSIAEQKAGNVHVGAGRTEADFVPTREARDATLSMPALILPALQVNLRGGRLPEPDAEGRRFLKLPLDAL